jgi:hypothetical protein
MLVMGACTSSTAPERTIGSVASLRTDKALFPIPSAAQDSAGSVRFYGTIPAPCWPSVVSSSAQLSGPTLRVVVTIAAAGSCWPLVTDANYVVQLTDVPRGNYVLDVAHQVGQQPVEVGVYSLPVTVR